MADPISRKAFESGREEWNKWRQSTISQTFTFLQDENLEGKDFSKWNFQNIVFPGCKLTGCSFYGGKLDGAVFQGVSAIEAEFCAFSYGKFQDSFFTSVKFESNTLACTQATVVGCEFRDCIIPHFTARGAAFDQTRFIQCQFEKITAGSSLSGAQFENARFLSSCFTGVDLRGAKFGTGTEFQECDLTGALVGDGTDFSHSQLSNCRIDRATIELLEPTAFTQAQKAQLRISDAVKEMRMAFSGLMQFVHVTALIIFLAPYVLFLVQNYLMGHTLRNFPHGITLLEKFGQFVLSAGFTQWPTWEHEALLGFLFAYNVLRAILVWKTKHLEMDQASTGRYPNFVLKGAWGFWFLMFKYGFWINLSLIAMHTYSFMQLKVPPH